MVNIVNLQNVIIYVIMVMDGKNQDYVIFDNSMVINGGGKVYIVQLGDVVGLQDVLLLIFNEIQVVNSVFVLVSLLVVVNV